MAEMESQKPMEMKRAASPKRRSRVWRILLFVFAGLVVLLVVVPYLIPIPRLENTVPPEQLADADSAFGTIEGLRFHFKLLGSGSPTFVLLHGFGASLFSWREVLAPLSRKGSVLAYDRPAFGLTERPLQWQGDNPYALSSQLEQLVAWLDRLQATEAILVGNSAGGTIAAEMALRYPERVQALILVDPAIYDSGGISWFVRSLLQFPPFRRLGPLLVRSIGSNGIDLLKSAWHDPTQITPEILAGYQKPLQADDWDRALWEFTLANVGSDLGDRLRELEVPTLVLTGDDDRIVPTEQSVRAASEIPGAKLVVIPNCGHVPQEEKPQEFLSALEEFLVHLSQ
jgi:pimeloyl-ACP methyl ester carboxylesterase